jgi:light-harvesting protein B-800-850 alpha chain
MNQGRIWCVVHPTIGLPLLLGSVAATSLIVHASIMTHTTWMGTYWMGKAARVQQTSSLVPPAAPASFVAPAGFSVTVAQSPASGPTQAGYVITLTPAPAKAPAATQVSLPAHPAALPIHTASAN